MTPPTTDLDDAVNAVQDLALAMEAFRTAAAVHFAIGVRDTEAVSYLRSRGPMSHHQLAQALRLTRGSVTALVDRLVADGLARRVPQPHDRRTVLVELIDEPPLVTTSVTLLRRSLSNVPGATKPETLAILRGLADELRRNQLGRQPR